MKLSRKTKKTLKEIVNDKVKDIKDIVLENAYYDDLSFSIFADKEYNLYLEDLDDNSLEIKIYFKEVTKERSSLISPENRLEVDIKFLNRLKKSLKRDLIKAFNKNDLLFENACEFFELDKNKLIKVTNKEEELNSLKDYKVGMHTLHFMNVLSNRDVWVDVEGLGFGWAYRWEEKLSREENLIKNEKAIRGSVFSNNRKRDKNSLLYKEIKEDGDIYLYDFSFYPVETLLKSNNPWHIEHSVFIARLSNKDILTISEKYDF